MSVRRTAVPVLFSLVTAALVASGGVASAEPRPETGDPCSSTLARAAVWPGVVADGVRLVSDAYVTHLSEQPECTADRV